MALPYQRQQPFLQFNFLYIWWVVQRKSLLMFECQLEGYDKNACLAITTRAGGDLKDYLSDVQSEEKTLLTWSGSLITVNGAISLTDGAQTNNVLVFMQWKFWFVCTLKKLITIEIVSVWLDQLLEKFLGVFLFTLFNVFCPKALTTSLITLQIMLNSWIFIAFATGPATSRCPLNVNKHPRVSCWDCTCSHQFASHQFLLLQVQPCSHWFITAIVWRRIEEWRSLIAFWMHWNRNCSSRRTLKGGSVVQRRPLKITGRCVLALFTKRRSCFKSKYKYFCILFSCSELAHCTRVKTYFSINLVKHVRDRLWLRKWIKILKVEWGGSATISLYKRMRVTLKISRWHYA